MTETRESRLAAEGTPLQQLNFATFLREARTAEWTRRADYYRRFVALFSEGDAFTQDQAEYLDEIYHRRSPADIEPSGTRPTRKRDPASYVGSRPRTPASIKRRRSYVMLGMLPDSFVGDRRWGLYAVLSFVATQIIEYSRCTAYVAEIGAKTGYCETTVHQALQLGRDRGWIKVEARRRPGALRNDSNVVTVIDPAWLAWLRVRVDKWRGITKRARAYWRLDTGYTFGQASSTRDRYSVGQKPDNMPPRTPSAPGRAAERQRARTGPPGIPRTAPG